jgi:predicted acetyltransferase
MVDIRPPVAAEREAIAALHGLAFNAPVRPDRVFLDDWLCTYDGGRLIATARAIDFDQWFGGARVPCVGVAGVAVQPEDRGRGAARLLVGELLRQQREEGRLVSALYPSTAALYRRLGYEFAGFRPQFRVSVTDLPPTGGATGAAKTEGAGAGARVMGARVMGENEIGEVMKCYSRFAAAHNGPVEVADPAYWVQHTLAHDGEGTHQRTVVVDGEAGLDGYASYFLDRRDDLTYPLVCKHLVANGASALSSLLSYFRRFENAAQDLVWIGPASAGPVGLAVQANGFTLFSGWGRWMARVLDIPRALEARGYPAVEGEATISIDDPLFGENAGPWLVRASAGRVSVQPADERGKNSEAVPIGLFSALYTGLATPSDLVLLGALEQNDARLGFLSALFAGPVPWMFDGF